MLVALLTLPLLVATAHAYVFNTKFESTERMGLDIPLTRTLKFYISDDLCSGVITPPLYDEDCKQPLAMLVTAQDNKIPEITLMPELNKTTVLRKRNEKKDCPGKAPVIVTMACPLRNGRRVRSSAVERPLPVATDEEYEYMDEKLKTVNM